RPADQVALERFEDVVARDAEVVRVAHADPAAARLGGLRHRDRVRPRPDDEAEAVVAVDGRRARALADDRELRSRIDAPELEHVVVGVQPSDAVAVDPSEVGAREDAGGEGRVLRGHAEVLEDARGERAQALDGNRPALDQRREPTRRAYGLQSTRPVGVELYVLAAVHPP